jgi:KAP family P-loop domain
MTEREQLYYGDALGRASYAKKLTSLIERLPKGVIAIDGDWGVGKSWFGSRLKADLDQQSKMGTIWIDVFDADWDDDPAMSLIAGIAAGLPSADEKSFIEKVSPYLLKALPIATKVAIKVAGNYLGFDKDVVSATADAGKTGSDDFIKRHLEDAANKKKTLDGLKELLAEAIQTHHKKLVIFVDELDRCSPAYGIRFLERLKHLFDLDGVVYVLLWNRQQIQSVVETFYGSGVNGQMYLDKFVDYPLHLPMSQSRADELPFEGLVRSIVQDFEREKNSAYQLSENSHWIAVIASILQLTARETKRISAWWVMSPNRQFPVFETWLLGLKVKHPDIFAGLRSGSRDAHERALELLSNRSIDARINKEVIKDLTELHSRFASNNFGDLNQHFIRNFSNPGGDFSDAVKGAMRRLELDFG